jgi:hypothetical protein
VLVREEWIRGNELFRPRVSSPKVLRDTLSSNQLDMSTVADRQFALSDRRDRMILSMATHAARVKTKAREAKQQAVRQVGYRTERYQQFKGRRTSVLQEDVQARRNRRSQAMRGWLEAQALVNAEEGTPREVAVVVFETVHEVKTSEPVSEVVDGEGSDESQRLITTFFVVRR